MAFRFNLSSCIMRSKGLTWKMPFKTSEISFFSGDFSLESECLWTREEKNSSLDKSSLSMWRFLCACRISNSFIHNGATFEWVETSTMFPKQTLTKSLELCSKLNTCAEKSSMKKVKRKGLENTIKGLKNFSLFQCGGKF